VKNIIESKAMSDLSYLIKKIRQQPEDVRTMTHNGYIYLKIPSCEYKTVEGWISEHMFKAQFVRGRKLKTQEHVHHIDLNKLNNSIHNLCVMKAEKHKKYHRKVWVGGSPDLTCYVKEFLDDRTIVKKKKKSKKLKRKQRKARLLAERIKKKEAKKQEALRLKKIRDEWLKTPKKPVRDQTVLPSSVEVFQLKSKYIR